MYWKCILILMTILFSGLYNRTIAQNAIQDGDFEDGPSSYHWIPSPQFQIYHDSVLTGMGLNANSGSYAAIFQQDWMPVPYTAQLFHTGPMIIPSSNFAELSMYINLFSCGSPNDSIIIKIDDIPVIIILGTSPTCGDSIWHYYASDISQFADGMYHNFQVHIYYEYLQGNAANFLFDDFFISTHATSNSNVIKGNIFVDSNLSGAPDTGETFLPYLPITEINTGNTVFSNFNSSYYLALCDTGTFTIQAPVFSHYNCTPQSITKNFNSYGIIDSNNYFAYQPVGTVNDLKITIAPLTVFRPGRIATYLISYSNVGTTQLTPEIIFHTGNNILYSSSSVTPAQVITDSIVWFPGALNPFESGRIYLDVLVDSVTVAGAIINSTAEILPVSSDATPADNYHGWEVITVTSCDPNDIMVSLSDLNSNVFPNPPYLNYLIRFQNTGNDTAFTVRIENFIEETLDIATFEFTNASHPVQVFYNTSLRTFQFVFDNILLPDSNVNEEESHGYLIYRIKPVNSLIDGDSVQNSASIFFDFNLPVITNTVTTLISDTIPLPVPEMMSSIIHVIPFPNPSSDFIYIKNLPIDFNENISAYTFNSLGVLVSTQTLLQNPPRIDVSSFASGVYFTRLLSKSGKSVGSFKFVKE